MPPPASLGDGQIFLLAIGLGAIVGVMLGGWIMAALHKLMMVLVKLALLGAVLVICLMLYSGYQGSQPAHHHPVLNAPSVTRLPPHAKKQLQQAPPPPTSTGRWWETSKRNK